MVDLILIQLPQRLGFLGQLLRKPESSLKDMTPEELRVEAARRETVDVNAEEDITVLRERCENLIYAREHLKAKNTELKQMLTEAQVRLVVYRTTWYNECHCR